MSDLIERLRKGHGLDSYEWWFPTKLDTEAADEIERLEAEVSALQHSIKLITGFVPIDTDMFIAALQEYGCRLE